MKRVLQALGLLVLLTVLVGVASYGQHYGGTLRWAVANECISLDMMIISSQPVMQIGQHIYETLFAFDETWAPHPYLVESYQKSIDGLTIVMGLRQGVLFHNGKEMTADDVVASLNRWLLVGQRGIPVAPLVTSVEKLDAYTVKMVFNKPYAPLENMLAYPIGGPIIIPQEVCEAAGKNQLTDDQVIGTGPYKLAEWQKGRFVRLVRFDDYKARSEEPRAATGKRTAYIDEIIYYTVPDAMTRVAGVQAGDYDYTEAGPPDLYDSLSTDARVRTYAATPPEALYIMFNTKAGLLANETLRQALLTALDLDAVIAAAYGSLGQTNCAIAGYVPGMAWYTSAGNEMYDQGNVAKAQGLAAAAGYNGEPIRFMSTTTHSMLYNASLVVADQWTQAGFNIDFQIYDWATVTQRRADPANWEVFITSGGPKPDPALSDQMTPTYPSWWSTPARNTLAELVNTEVDPARRYSLWEMYQTLFYYQAPSAMLGVGFRYSVASPRLANLDNSPSHPHAYWPYMYNVWFE